MRVAVYYSNRDVRLEDRELPVPGPGEVLVKVRASGICGSDVLEWYRKPRAPLVLGHEMVGEIAELGAGVEAFSPGERVFVSHHVPCNTCRHCLRGNHTACRTLHTTNFDPGGFAEFVRVPRLQTDRGIFPLPAAVDDTVGTFVEPLACVVRGQRLARLRPGDAVLILGSGISGQLNLQLAQALGAATVITTDVDEFRLEVARSQGATAALHASTDVAAKVRELNAGRLADVVIVCTGARAAFDQALSAVEPGGTVLFFAAPEPGATLPLPVNEFWRNGITLLPSYGAAPADIATSIELLCAARIQVLPLVTHRLPLAQAPYGFRLMAGLEKERSLKVVLEP